MCAYVKRAREKCVGYNYRRGLLFKKRLIKSATLLKIILSFLQLQL